MEVLLNYESHGAISRSICSVFCICDEEAVSTIDSIGFGHDISESLDELLLASFYQSFGFPSAEIYTTWFHGTRTVEPESFLKLGILPKSGIKSRIHEMILSLSSGIEKDGENPFSMSLSGKDGGHDEGPFASLFKEAVTNPCHGGHNYLDAPEIVEDIAGELFGENYTKLIKRYKKKARPYCICFKMPAFKEQVGRGLRYMYLVENGYSTNEAANL